MLGQGPNPRTINTSIRGCANEGRNGIRSEPPRGENEEESFLGWARPRTESIVCHQEQQSGPFQGRG